MENTYTSLTYFPLPWWRILTDPAYWSLMDYWYAYWSLIDHDSFTPLLTHMPHSWLIPLLYNPLPCHVDTHRTGPRHCSLPVYKSAIWVPCSPSSDLVILSYLNTSWILPDHPLYVRLPLHRHLSIPWVSKGSSLLSTPYRLSHSRRCLLVQPYPFHLER